MKYNKGMKIMAWPKGTYIKRLMIKDPPQYFLGAVWDCTSSTSSYSKLLIKFPWDEIRTVKVNQERTSKWYNPKNKTEWLSFWSAGCSSGGTYGIANYEKGIPIIKTPIIKIPTIEIPIIKIPIIKELDLTGRIITDNSIIKNNINSKIIIGIIFIISIILLILIKKR